MADSKLTGLSAISQANVDDTALLYIVDVTGGNVSRKVTKGNLFAGTTKTQLVIGLPTGPTGSASVFYGGIKIAAATVAFATTAQTNDYYTNFLDQATLTNPSSGTVPNAATLKIVGAPIASTNVTITNPYSLWIAGGKSRFDEQVSLTSTSNTVLSITPTSAPTGSASEFIAGINTIASTVAFATTQQTGDFIGRKMGQSTLTNPSSGTITNASTLKITGAPIASTNVTITNAYALWVAAGTTKLDGSISATGLLTSTGGITMSSADITLAGNSILTTNYTIKEASVQGDLAILLQPTSGNLNGQFTVAPSGTSRIGYINIFRTSDTTTNKEVLAIGSDFFSTGEFDIQVTASGSGSRRPINVYMGSTKLLSFDTANTISSYVNYKHIQSAIVPEIANGTEAQSIGLDPYNGNNLAHTIANNGTFQPFGSTAFHFSGLVMVSETGVGNWALLAVSAEAGTVTIVYQSSNTFSNAQGTASKHNCYVTGNVFTIENKTGGSDNYIIFGMRILGQ